MRKLAQKEKRGRFYFYFKKNRTVPLLQISTEYVGNLHISLTHNTPRISILEEMKEISRINGRG